MHEGCRPRAPREAAPPPAPFMGYAGGCPFGSLPWGRWAPAPMSSIRHLCRMFDARTAGTSGNGRRTGARGWHVVCRKALCRPDPAWGHAPPDRAHTKGGDTWPIFVRPPTCQVLGTTQNCPFLVVLQGGPSGPCGVLRRGRITFVGPGAVGGGGAGGAGARVQGTEARERAKTLRPKRRRGTPPRPLTSAL